MATGKSSASGSSSGVSKGTTFQGGSYSGFQSGGNVQTGSGQQTSQQQATTASPYGAILGAISTQLAKAGGSTIGDFLAQMQDVLSGKLTPSLVPLVGSGVSAVQQAGTAATADIQDILGQTGTGRSSFAASVLGNAASAERQAIGAVPGQVEQTFLGLMPQAVGALGTAYGGLGTAAQTNLTTTGSTLANYLNNLTNQFSQTSGGQTFNYGQTSGVNMGSQAGAGSTFNLGSLLGPLEAWLMGGGG